MAKFKVGDKVKCKNGLRDDGPNGRPGAGYQSGLEFIITKITLGPSNDPIYWKGMDSHGVFEHALELASEWDT